MPRAGRSSLASARPVIRSAKREKCRRPVLNGLIGRQAGSVPGYSYSAANKNSGITWDEATFREYIKDPKAKIPGTKMIYAGTEG
jgi:cytochrome c2